MKANLLFIFVSLQVNIFHKNQCSIKYWIKYWASDWHSTDEPFLIRGLLIYRAHLKLLTFFDGNVTKRIFQNAKRSWIRMDKCIRMKLNTVYEQRFLYQSDLNLINAMKYAKKLSLDWQSTDIDWTTWIVWMLFQAILIVLREYLCRFNLWSCSN